MKTTPLIADVVPTLVCCACAGTGRETERYLIPGTGLTIVVHGECRDCEGVGYLPDIHGLVAS